MVQFFIPEWKELGMEGAKVKGDDIISKLRRGDDKIHTLVEVARALNLKPEVILELVDQDRLPCIRPDSHVIRFLRSDVIAYAKGKSLAANF